MHVLLMISLLVAEIPHHLFSSFCQRETVDSVYNECAVEAAAEFGKDSEAGTCYLMADWAYGVSLLELSQFYLDKALDAEISDEVLRADCLSLGSAVARLKGDLTAAIRYAEECLEIDRNTGVEDNISSSLNNIAGLYMTYGDPESARKYIDEALEIEQKLGRSGYLAVRYGVASEIYLHLGLHDQALAFVNKAFELDSLDNRTEKVAVRRSQKAEVLMQIGQVREAEKQLAMAVPVFRMSNNLNSLAISLVQIAEIRLKDGRLQDAENAFNECVDVCFTSGNIYIESRAREGLWSMYKDSAPAMALTHLERYVELKDRLVSEDANEQMQSFNVKYETLKKEQTIHMQKQRLRWALLCLALLFALLILACVIVVLKIRAAKAVERKNAVLVQANIDKERLLALAKKDIPADVSSEIEDIATRYVELPQIHLTAREKEIAQMCAQGLLSKEIAAQLGISPRTVETHKNNLFKKLGINNTVELMRYMQMTSTSSKR